MATCATVGVPTFAGRAGGAVVQASIGARVDSRARSASNHRGTLDGAGRMMECHHGPGRPCHHPQPGGRPGARTAGSRLARGGRGSANRKASHVDAPSSSSKPIREPQTGTQQRTGLAATAYAAAGPQSRRTHLFPSVASQALKSSSYNNCIATRAPQLPPSHSSCPPFESLLTSQSHTPQDRLIRAPSHAFSDQTLPITSFPSPSAPLRSLLTSPALLPIPAPYCSLPIHLPHPNNQPSTSRARA